MIKWKPIKFIGGERINLIRCEEKYKHDIFEYCSDEKINYFLSFEVHKSITDTEKNIQEYYLNEPEGKFLIQLKKNNKVIGAINIRSYEKDYGIGYVVNKNFQNLGYCTEAVKTLTDFAFEKFKYKKIYALHDIENVPSERVMEKAGFIKTGMYYDTINKYNKPSKDCVHLKKLQS
ncbi:GNAT family N-acetyltransferase [Spiroplasma apis]|uniref:Acetyltransferase, GNAT family n=1 Tax=Spiroplasma apis B31 TaxID=1276258 RepID=V5RIQ9_SPIAP|nr:GNAT family N-acetyltransferase [Spiroplasma apis]AHB36449.1 acetyltransferase, GNAT family [Spiroplasma apis B31]